MDVAIIDATHGGVKLAVEFSKLNKYENIYLHDIYNTLKDEDKSRLYIKNVQVADLDQINSKELLVISPVHLPLTENQLKNKINSEKYSFINHHEAINLLTHDFFKKHEDILKIEITGVKGKTSSVFLLKEILKDFNPLILSSLGIIQSRDEKDILLKKNISITPANIKEAIDLAYRIDNPQCNLGCKKTEQTDNINYKSIILESSLGVTGIGDVGLLTNIVENYPIANNNSDAKTAKSQVFRCRRIAVNQKTLDKYYKKQADEYKSKINTFSADDLKSNVRALNINYNLNQTTFKIVYENVKTINNNNISGEFNIESFAIGKHHVENILGAVTVALTLEISENQIINGLSNYKGIEGRTQLEQVNGLTIIKEINPGINSKAIEFSINMLKNPEKWSIIIGGDYGITCEEIDEDKVCQVIKNRENLILTGAVGKSLNKHLNGNFVESYEDAIDNAINNNLNVLFIYRSDYRKLSQR